MEEVDPMYVRNFTIAANVDSGKSTFSDSMLCYAGLINKNDAGDKLATDTMKIEQDRGITIKSVGVTMLHKHEDKNYIMNMIDSPGHIDFSAEVTAAVRVSDGVFVLIDPIDGVMAQTKTVLIQSLTERVQPVLLINKIDKLFLSLRLTPDEIYNQCVKNINDVNAVITDYQDMVQDQCVDPVKGNVMFGSAYHTWGFTLKTFAKMYAQKSGSTVESLMKKLWVPKNFVDMIIKPIYTVLKACTSYPEDSSDGKNLKTLVETLNIHLKSSDYDLRGKELIRKVMGTWLPIAPTAVELAVDHLPSPKQAQRYRAELLYKGVDANDPYLKAIQECDASGPMILYISKMVPNRDNTRFLAFGRVFSGTVSAKKVKILLYDHDPVTNPKIITKSIQRVVLMMGPKTESVSSVPAGNILAVEGVDEALIKSGTIVDESAGDCYPLRTMAFSVSPVVQYALTPKNLSDLPKFSEILRKFVKSDPCLQYLFTSEGEHLLCGSGELHLEVAIEQLRTDFMKNIEFTLSEPIIPYVEAVTLESRITCLAKSPNKHNRLYCRAEPLPELLVKEMISNSLPKDPKERARYLIDNFNFDDGARKIWKFGPEVEPCNLVLDATKGVQYINEIKDSFCAGFMDAVERGPLCEEPLRGVRINVLDVTLHADAIHRGGGQIAPTTRNVIYASILSAAPVLLEPVFKVEISLPRERVSSIYGLMNKRRGVVTTVMDEEKTSRVEADLPVAESFGFIDDLRGTTSGTGFATLCFSHYQQVPGNPLEDGSYSNKIALKIRKRKGLKEIMPNLEDYNDKL
jgi:elongation factor 2